jgi:hypothetical protein
MDLDYGYLNNGALLLPAYILTVLIPLLLSLSLSSGAVYSWVGLKAYCKWFDKVKHNPKVVSSF